MSDVLFTIQHPADVHLFRNAIQQLSEQHEVHVFVREKDVNIELLNRYDIKHEVLTTSTPGIVGTVKTQLIYEYKLFRRAMEIQPDVMCADGGIAISHISSVLDSTSLVFTDTEHVVDSALDRRHLIYNFADEVYTPDCYWLDLGANHFQYSGYHELAYLHPDRFEPDPSIRQQFEIDDDDVSIALLRLVSWEAFHDRGNSGLSEIGTVIDYLEDSGMEVFISSEGEIPGQYAHLEVDLPVDEIHHLMSEADLFVGESSTMASECAMLGTPAVFISSLQLGYLEELEHEYDLVVNLTPNEEQYLLNEVETILEKDDQYWETQRQRLLEDKIDTSNYIVERISRHLSTDHSTKTDSISAASKNSSGRQENNIE
ncbi:DUF354 domain-containing protein [Natronorubrum aibiense]|uniref:DUF354 domain-containing protein n=1 Tax=Natronorubrum aibiense TaxID=348826 RepID=A0A5P9P2C7_9EURY|nr:DUF354 domain-containing protein [Natronorubrum aibiense]QFU82283.1 DUF354 domain-containing protein [Natronorubrum aibiense]